MLADLHIHSTYSDGIYSPDEICQKAARRGLSLLSITDHDTLAGLENKRAAAKKYGLQYLSGWEISAYEGEQKIHILGYGCELGDAYERFTQARKDASFARAKESAEKFQRLGFPVTFDEILAQRASPDLPVHTMHIARAAAKYVGLKEGDTYREYLSPRGVSKSNLGRPTPQEAIDVIHAAGGLAFVAHPGRLDMDEKERERVIRDLAAYGVDGIECVYTTHTERETTAFSALAKELRLLCSGGSDTHYEDESHGIGAPSFFPDEELLKRLGL